MGCVTQTNECHYYSGLVISLWMWFVSRRLALLLVQNVSPGFPPMVFLVLSLPRSAHPSGVAVLLRPSLDLVNSVFDSNSRFIMGHFKYHGLTFGVACVYAPNRNPDRNDFFDFCIDQIDPSIPTIICGDFNTVFDRSLDRRGSDASDCSCESTLSLKSLFRECCVIDVWHSLHPTTIGFTWLRPDGLLSSRIDIIGCPSARLHLVNSCDILPCPFSDHAAVSLNCALPEPIPRSPCKIRPFAPLSLISGLFGDNGNNPFLPFRSGGVGAKVELKVWPSLFVAGGSPSVVNLVQS